MAPKKKVKKSKKKSKPSGKQDLDKQADLFIQSESLHKMFIDRIGTWLLSNFGRVVDIFRKFDKNGDGMLSYEEFFAGMSDLQAPCSKVELLVLAKTVDRNKDGNIEYSEFSQGIKYRRPVKVEIDDGLPVLKIQHEKFEKCPNCDIKKWNFKQRTKRSISLDLILDSMKGSASFPGHLKSIRVDSDVSVQGIKDRIVDTYDKAFRDVTIFCVTNGSRIVLDNDNTLEGLGYKGGTDEEPMEVCLYYELGSNTTATTASCPILECDHYFSKRK